KFRVQFEQTAGRLHGVEVMFGNFPAGIDRIPFKLALHVRDEVAGLARAHAAEDLRRDRPRSRMPLKSDLVSGVTDLSAASSSHASSSGVISKNFRCCSRSERMTSLTNSLASAHTPERTWSRRKSSTSLAKATVMVENYRWLIMLAMFRRPP